jgi:hypothetical protein
MVRLRSEVRIENSGAVWRITLLLVDSAVTSKELIFGRTLPELPSMEGIDNEVDSYVRFKVVGLLPDGRLGDVFTAGGTGVVALFANCDHCSSTVNIDTLRHLHSSVFSPRAHRCTQW